MNQVYDPLKDPASDGFVDLSQSPTKAEWKATSQSALGVANDAREATEAEQKSFWTAFRVCVAMVLIFAVFWACMVHFTKKREDHEARVNSINAPAGSSPEIGASPSTKKQSAKSATKNVADKAINTPASSGFEGEKTPEIKQEKAGPEPVPPSVEKQPLSVRELAYEQRQLSFDNRSSTIGEKP